MTETRTALPKRALEVLRWVMSYQRRVGYMPSIREVAAAHGMVSHNGAKYYLEMLEDRGYLARGPRSTARTLRVTPAGERAAAG